MIKTLQNNMCRKTGIITILLIFFFLFGFNAKAQVVSSTEIGIMGGGSYYLGDINSNHFDYMMPSGGIVIRKNIDRRIVVKGELLVAQ